MKFKILLEQERIIIGPCHMFQAYHNHLLRMTHGDVCRSKKVNRVFSLKFPVGIVV